MEEFQVHRI